LSRRPPQPSPHSASLGNERVARGDDVVARLGAANIVICGAGAIGANLAEHLARMGACGQGQLRVVDDDRVEARNLTTQPWQRADVGQLKVKVLATQLFRSAGLDVDARSVRLTADNAAALVAGADLVVDAFDNAPSRQVVQDACRRDGLACLHVGLAKGYAEVIWDERYTVPPLAGADVCDVGLARSLVVLAAVVGAEAIAAFVARTERRSFTITLADLRVTPLP